jgi:hypothetical protein
MADPSVTEEKKTCTQCGEAKALCEYRTYKEVAGIGKRRQRQRTECRTCAANRCKESRVRIRTAELEIAQKRLETLAPEKRCYICTATKPIEQFRRINYITSTGKLSWRFDSRCLECTRERDRQRYQHNQEKEKARVREYGKRTREERTAVARLYRQTNPEKLKQWREAKYNRDLERKYGVTFEIFQGLIERYGRQCMICKNSEGKIGVDHCHKTGKIRGLLCNGCNLALGNIKEDLDRARGLAHYIEAYCK